MSQVNMSLDENTTEEVDREIEKKMREFVNPELSALYLAPDHAQEKEIEGG